MNNIDRLKYLYQSASDMYRPAIAEAINLMEKLEKTKHKRVYGAWAKTNGDNINCVESLVKELLDKVESLGKDGVKNIINIEFVYHYEGDIMPNGGRLDTNTIGYKLTTDEQDEDVLEEK